MKKNIKAVLPFRMRLGSTTTPMTFDQAMDVILDPVNIKPPRKGKKRSQKK